MARYFFHLYNDLNSLDEEGTDFPHDQAAREHAIRSARDVSCETIAAGRLNLDHYIEVIGHDGRRVWVVTFGDAISVTGRRSGS